MDGLNLMLDPQLNRAGDDPDCKHENATREHLSGRGQSALYHWHCPDCGESEVEGYEGED